MVHHFEAITLHLEKTKLYEVPGQRPKARVRQGGTATASHVLCERKDSAELRPLCLGKHFTGPTDHDNVLHRRYGTTGRMKELANAKHIRKWLPCKGH
jgi:hypothetical protein